MKLNAVEARKLNRLLNTLWRPSLMGGEGLPDADECEACSEILTAFLQAHLAPDQWGWVGDGRLMHIDENVIP